MTASVPSSGGNSSLAIKCMDFCHALASQGKAFSFTLSVGSDFSFSLDARDKKQAAPVLTAEVKKKKLSPSQVRRNARRRQEFLKRKSETLGKGNLGSPAAVEGIPCAPAPPCASRRLVTKLRRRANTWTFSQLDGAPPSPPSSPSGQPKEEEGGFKQAEVPTPTPSPPTATPPPSTPSPSPPVVLKKPVKMLNGDPIWVKKK